MKKILTILFLFISCQLSVVNNAYADSNSFSLGVSPSVIQINAKQPANIQTEIKITNKGDSVVNLTLNLKPFIPQGSNGEINYSQDANNPTNIVIQKIKLYDQDQPVTNVTLSPDETKTIQLRLNVDNTISNGDYYFSLLFISKPALDLDGKSASTTSGGIGTNILLSIGDKNNISGDIVEFSTSSFLSHGPVPFTLLLENTSNNYILPTGDITITDMFGRSFKSIDILPRYILAHARRYMTDKSFSTSSQMDTKIENHNILIWPEKELFGIYTAKVTIKLSDKGPTFTRSLSFVAIPLYFVLAISIFAFILIGIYIKTKKKI